MLWLVIVLFVAMSVAVLRGGRLTNLADIRLKMWWLLPLGFAMQGIAGIVDPDIGFYVVLTSYLPLLALMILNRDRSGLWLAGVGVLLNFTVIALNGGMPVLEGAIEVAAGYAPGGPRMPPSTPRWVLTRCWRSWPTSSQSEWRIRDRSSRSETCSSQSVSADSSRPNCGARSAGSSRV
jgi:hypothetical protein